MFKAYFDESGHSSQHRFVCVAGCVASVDAWDCFEREWRAELDAAEISIFHMTDFESSRGEFAKWANDLQAHKNFIAKLITIMNRHVNAYVAGTETVRRDSTGKLVYKDEPYFAALLGGADSVASYMGALDLEERAEVHFAEQRNFTSKARELVSFLNSNDPRYARFSSHTHNTSPKVILPFQAADLVAFEVRKELERPIMRYDTPPRWPYVQLLKNRFYWNGSLIV